jgi:hypothetical protein
MQFELHERAAIAEREASLLREQTAELRRDRDRWHAIAEERLTKLLEARPPHQRR